MRFREFYAQKCNCGQGLIHSKPVLSGFYYPNLELKSGASFSHFGAQVSHFRAQVYPLPFGRLFFAAQ